MANKKSKLTDDQQKTLLLLKSTYEMHCKTREEAIMMGKTKNLDKIDRIIAETLQQIGQIDMEFANQCVAEYHEKNKKHDVMDAINSADTSQTVFDMIGKEEDITDLLDDDEVKRQTQSFYDQFASDDDVDLYKMADEIPEDVDTKSNSEVIDSFSQRSQEVGSSQLAVKDTEDMIHNNVDPSAQYDLIPLPSKGECYRVKVDRVPVGYLTAADENLITSPNLYESGSISSILLKKKILNKDINIDNLVSGDVDAIMVFLRGTSYGNDFPITATDPKTGAKIDTVADLSKLKYKPFSLKGDENGFFDFKLPRTGAMLKFKFLTNVNDIFVFRYVRFIIT